MSEIPPADQGREPRDLVADSHRHMLRVVRLRVRLGHILVYDWTCACGWRMGGTRTEAAYYGDILD